MALVILEGRYDMVISQSILDYLQDGAVKFTVLSHDRTRTLEETADGINAPYAKMLRAVILDDGKQYYMAVLPVTHVLDFKSLRQQLGNDVHVSQYSEFAERFKCCEKGSVPPLGAPFGLAMLIDQSITTLDEVYFEPGSHTSAIKIPVAEYARLVRTERVGRFAYPLTDLAEMDVSTLRYASPQDMKRRIEEIYELPPIPDVAMRILELGRDDEASSSELAEIVETDPSLSAQTLRYASSPLFGYRGEIDSIQDAIARVLGFDMAMNMALGLSVGKHFRIDVEGPLGMDAFWRHSVACATLTQRLAHMMPAAQRPKPGMAYLAGLLHNFGFLLLGHLFQPEFYLLNKLIAANPDRPVTELEQQVLGMGRARDVIEMGHAQIGSWLMEAWGLPEQVSVTVREHHHADYDGEHAVYVKLVRIANRLLKRAGIGDAASGELPAELLAELGLDETGVVACFESLIDADLDEVDAMAHQMAA